MGFVCFQVLMLVVGSVEMDRLDRRTPDLGVNAQAVFAESPAHLVAAFPEVQDEAARGSKRERRMVGLKALLAGSGALAFGTLLHWYDVSHQEPRADESSVGYSLRRATYVLASRLAWIAGGVTMGVGGWYLLTDPPPPAQSAGSG